jgi:hypothetical protein
MELGATCKARGKSETARSYEDETRFVSVRSFDNGRPSAMLLAECIREELRITRISRFDSRNS